MATEMYYLDIVAHYRGLTTKDVEQLILCRRD